MDTAPTSGPPRHRRHLFTVIVVVLAVAGLAWFVATNLDDLLDALSLLRHADWWWVVASVAVGMMSMVLFGAVRALLLGAGGARMGLLDASSLSLESGAIAASVPGGGAVATAYTIRRYRDAGAEPGLAGWTTVATGVVAPFALVAITLAGLALARHGDGRAVLPSVAAVGLFVGFLWLSRRPGVLVGPTRRLIALWRRLARRPAAERTPEAIDAVARRFVAEFGATRPTPWRWAAVWAIQVVSWLTDYATMLITIVAVGGAIPWSESLAIFGIATLAGTIPLLPGGVGQVEAAMVVALTATGMDASVALAATVLYRVVSLWIIVPPGWLLVALQRRRVGEGDAPVLPGHR